MQNRHRFNHWRGILFLCFYLSLVVTPTLAGEIAVQAEKSNRVLFTLSGLKKTSGPLQLTYSYESARALLADLKLAQRFLQDAGKGEKPSFPPRVSFPKAQGSSEPSLQVKVFATGPSVRVSLSKPRSSLIVTESLDALIKELESSLQKADPGLQALEKPTDNKFGAEDLHFKFFQKKLKGRELGAFLIRASELRPDTLMLLLDRYQLAALKEDLVASRSAGRGPIHPLYESHFDYANRNSCQIGIVKNEQKNEVTVGVVYGGQDQKQNYNVTWSLSDPAVSRLIQQLDWAVNEIRRKEEKANS